VLILPIGEIAMRAILGIIAELGKILAVGYRFPVERGLLV
jgi:hypothetical protein